MAGPGRVRGVVALALASCWSVPGVAALGAAQAPEGERRPSKKVERLAEPWPDEQKLKERQQAAEERPLFRSAEPLAFTLAADFKAVNKERQLDSAKRFPAVLSVAVGGQPVAIPVQLRTRGKLRLNPKVCSFVPLRVEFAKEQARGTPFEGQGALKLVTHCQNSNAYDQHVLGEALAYRIGNLLSPASFRIRLARATYVDSVGGKTLATRWAIFVEDEDDLARRMQGRIAPLPKMLFRNLDLPSLLRFSVFEALIGNTDFSIHVLHNVRLVQDRQGALRPVAYDFDSSGLVSPPYAAPDPRLGLASVRDRRYRGPCLPLAELEPTLAQFRARKQEILALYDAEPALSGEHRSTAKRYLSEFFDVLESQRRSKLLFVDRCRPALGN